MHTRLRTDCMHKRVTSISISRTSFEHRWKESQNYNAFINGDTDHYTEGHRDGVVGNLNQLPPKHSNASVERSRELRDLTGHVTRDNTQPFARGRVADYWKGVWHHNSRMCKVSGLKMYTINKN